LSFKQFAEGVKNIRQKIKGFKKAKLIIQRIIKVVISTGE